MGAVLGGSGPFAVFHEMSMADGGPTDVSDQGRAKSPKGTERCMSFAIQVLDVKQCRGVKKEIKRINRKVIW